MSHLYSVPSEPPEPKRRASRASSWTDILAEYRHHPGEWRQVRQVMTRSFASQLASDFRNVHRRDLRTFRVRGVEPTDRFEARWANAPSDPNPASFYVWLRWTEVAWDDREGAAARW